MEKNCNHPSGNVPPFWQIYEFVLGRVHYFQYNCRNFIQVRRLFYEASEELWGCAWLWNWLQHTTSYWKNKWGRAVYSAGRVNVELIQFSRGDLRKRESMDWFSVQEERMWSHELCLLNHCILQVFPQLFR